MAVNQIAATARRLDRDLNLLPPLPPGGGPQPPGPVERQLQAVSPITVACIGGFGEGNNDLHHLVSEIASQAADKLQFSLGMEFKAAKARITEYMRRDISTVAVRGIASMILHRRCYAATHHSRAAGHLAETSETSDAHGGAGHTLRAVEAVVHEQGYAGADRPVG